MAKIRVLLADDHLVVRQGMRTMLNAVDDIVVIGEAADGLELLQMVEKLRPQVVLTDIAMPNLNGLEAIAQIHKHSPEIRVLVLSMHTATSYIIRALRSGAQGYLLKDDDIEQVVSAIRAVFAGQRVLSRQISEAAIEEQLTMRDDLLEQERRLTSREREILQMVGEGKTSNQIAERLRISPRTVETHRSNLMFKLKLESHADLVRFAIQHGFIGGM